MKRFLSNILNANQDVVGINKRNLALIYPNNPRQYFYLANDKATTKIMLEEAGIPIPETYMIITHSWEIDHELKQLGRLENFVVKPSNGSGGNGILILKKDGKDTLVSPGGTRYNHEMVKMHIASIIYGAFSHDKADSCIIEQRIEPDPFFLNIYPRGIPDIRIILLKEKPVMAMLRIPTDASEGKANLHQGAMGVGIDMQEGRITQGIYRNRIMECHPDTRVNFQGMQIPAWKDILNISESVAAAFPLKYLGVDIILDKASGPMIIEINARPGLQIQNANLKGIGAII